MKLKRLFTIVALVNLSIILTMLSLVSIAYADGPDVQTVYPPRNAITATLNTAVSVTYNQPMSATSVTSVTFAIHGMQSGLVTQTHGVMPSNTIMVTPNHSFFQGELVYVIATTKTKNITGTETITATQWQFNAGMVTNRCVASFTDINAGLTGVHAGSVDWGDYDNDGDLDILLTGQDSTSSPNTELYENNSGVFTASAILTDVMASSVDWGDYDNDGDLDILLSGQDSLSNPIAEIYENDGGLFSHNITASAILVGVAHGSVAWGDYDNDGDLDILLTGYDSIPIPIAEIYENNNGEFSHNITASTVLTGVTSSSVNWGDYDGDGDLDILLTGYNSSIIPITEIYENDGDGFSHNITASTTLTDVALSSVAWGDYDNDGDLDILLTGSDGISPIAEIYNNNGVTFSHNITTSHALTGVSNSSVAWGDYDNDGDLDILLTGNDGTSPIAEIYNNRGVTFSHNITASHALTGVSNSSIAWGDYDNDGDLDILLTGFDGAAPIAKIYRNDDCPIADLAISKSVVPTNAVAGEYITYTLHITNQGGITAINATLSDTLPPSVTLRSLDQRDNSQVEFTAGISQSLRWYDPRPNENDNREWLELDSSPTGVFTSRVMDAQNMVSWTDISWLPRRPYLTPLPNGNGSENGYVYGNVDMTSNQLLLHLDGTFSDTSGLGNDGTCVNCPISATGRFSGALEFNAALSQSVVISGSANPIRYAIEAWVYPTAITDTSFILRAADGTVRHSQLLGIEDGHFQHTLFDGQRKTITASTTISLNTWYHLVGTAESNGDMKLFVNGKEVARQGGIGNVWDGGDQYRLGSSYQITRTLPPTGTTVFTDTTAYFSGRLDEVAVYSRTLSAGEALDHYLRGALRLNFQVRSCDDGNCAGEAFVGPDGTAATHYQDIGATPPSFALNGVPDNRYLQYRAVFESDTPSYTPQLVWVEIGPEHRMIEATQGSCTSAANDFSCNLGDIGAGMTVTVIAYGEVDSHAIGVISNTATVSASNAISNSASVTAVVSSEVALNIYKHDDDHNDDPYSDEVHRDWNYGATDPVNPGSVMTYVLQIYNNGPSDAWNVQISDTLPITVSGWITEGNWNPTCSLPASNVISCTVPSLEAYSWPRPRLIITGSAPTLSDGSIITNTAWITAQNSTVYTTSHISDTETTLITSLADLVVAKSASPDPVNPGEIVTFTISVTNTGPADAVNVILTDTLFMPAGLTGTVIITDGWSCPTAPDTELICTLPILPAGVSSTLQITATAPFSGAVGNRAAVSSSTVDPDEENNNDNAYANVLPIANLHIIKANVEDPVLAGSILTYTLTVSNSGYINAGERSSNMIFDNHRRIQIPWGGTGYPYPSPIYVGGMEGLIQNITVTLNALEHTFPADIEALLEGPDGQTVLLMASVGGGVDADGITLTINDSGTAMPQNTALTDTVVYRPTNHGLSGDMTSPAPSGPHGGSLSGFNNSSPNGTWRLYVYDTFDSDRGNFVGGWDLQIVTLTTDTVTVSDTLPVELSGVNITPPAGWTQIGSNPLMYETDNFPVGAYQVFTITATAPITGGVITNTAAITSTVADTFPDSNYSTITTTIIPAADLGVRKQVTPAGEIFVGEALTYTLTVSNAGPSLVQTPIIVTDLLPDGLTDITAVGCDTSSVPLITCTLPTGLESGMNTIFTITANAPITPSVITNTAWITSAVSDPDLGNNSDVVTFSVIVPLADLGILKQVSPADELVNGDMLTYTLTVSNAGPNPVRSVITVTDSLPDGLTGVTAGNCDISGVPLITCTLPDGLDVGEGAVFTITANVSVTASSITNTAWITSDVGDPDVNNNSDIAVVTVNHAPIFTSAPNLLAREEELYTYDIVAVDSDPGNVLTITAETLPAWLSFNDNGNGQAVLDGTAVEADIGDHFVELLVTDNSGLTDTQRFTITVSPNTYAIYLPVIMDNYASAPDLVVESLQVSANAITVTIKNQGAETIESLEQNEFWVDVYINPISSPAYNETWEHLSLHGLVWGVTQAALPLAPGDVLILTVGGAYYHADVSDITWPLQSTDAVWAQVDSANEETTYGTVLENHEIVGTPYNNVIGPILP